METPWILYQALAVTNGKPKNFHNVFQIKCTCIALHECWITKLNNYEQMYDQILLGISTVELIIQWIISDDFY